MVVCFGASWPASIYKSYVSRTSAGKSLFFLILVFIGYISGVIYKISAGFDYVSYVYILNTIMVGTDICLYFRNSRLDRQSSR
jgi:hypothetical protein